MMVTSTPNFVEKSDMSMKIGKAVAKKIESRTLSARTAATAEPTFTPLSESILILKGSPPADEGVIAARNMLAIVISRAYPNDSL